MMSDLLSGSHGFQSAAIQASSQSDLPLASAYPQVRPVSLITRPKHLMTLRCTTEILLVLMLGVQIQYHHISYNKIQYICIK